MLTFGESFGFIKAGKDMHNLMQSVDEGMDRQAPVSGSGSGHQKH
jgi:hypothetical protein